MKDGAGKEVIISWLQTVGGIYGGRGCILKEFCLHFVGVEFREDLSRPAKSSKYILKYW